MIQEKLDNNISKELLIVLSYCDKELVNKIPNNIMLELSSKAADSTLEYYIDETKSLKEQNISEECLNILSLLYYMYVEEDKDSILDMWINNEKSDNNE